MVAPGVVAQPAPEQLRQELQAASLNAGMPGILGAVRRYLAQNPDIVANADAASATASVIATEIARFPLANAQHYGAAGSMLVAAAPQAARQDIAAPVMNALVSAAGEDQRAAVEAQVVESVSVVAETTPEKAAQDLKAEAARRPISRPAADAPARSEEKQPEYGLAVGSFVAYPRVLVTEIYDDNIFAESTGETDDFITTVSPSLFVESRWDRHYLSMETGTALAAYSSHDREDSQDFWVGGDGRFDIGSNANLFGGARWSRDHEDRESVDDVNGLTPTRYYDTQAHGGTSIRLGNVALRMGGTYQHLDFQDVAALLGVINNDDRDRKLYTVGGRATWVQSRLLQPFVQASWDGRRYDSNLDDFGFDRESDGYRTSVGARVRMPGRLGMEAFAGYMAQDYEDGRYSDPSGATYGMSLEWIPMPLLTVTSYADRTIEETTLFGSPAYYYSVFGGAVDWEFRPSYLLNVNAQFSNVDYEGSSRSEDLIGAGVGLRYTITPRLFVEGEYAFRDLDSDAAGEDFDRNLFFLRIGGQL